MQKVALERSVLVKEVNPRHLILSMALGVMRGCLGLGSEGDCVWDILCT